MANNLSEKQRGSFNRRIQKTVDRITKLSFMRNGNVPVSYVIEDKEGGGNDYESVTVTIGDPSGRKFAGRHVAFILYSDDDRSFVASFFDHNGVFVDGRKGKAFAVNKMLNKNGALEKCLPWVTSGLLNVGYFFQDEHNKK